jgi:quercetin dioxygenase-like cupin family protein
MEMKTSKEAAAVSRILLENPRLKIYEMHLAPRQKNEMHSHPAYVSYLLTDARLRIEYADGTNEDRGYKAGEAGYRQAQQHTIENMGDEDVRIVIIELKG